MPTFVTVPDEAQRIAQACYQQLKADGHSLKVEYADALLPEAATIYVKDNRDQYIYIFDLEINAERLTLWSGFGRSCTSSTSVILYISDEVRFDAAIVARVRELGIGLCTVDSKNAIIEVVAPSDLSMNVALPPLNRHKPRMRRKLLKVHQKFQRGDWKSGFETACKVIEQTSKNYLIKYAKAGRVQVVGKKGVPRTITPKEVSKMPMGALKDVFCGKLMPTHLDSLLCIALKNLNGDRIVVAHDRLTARADRRLRQNVGKHMWTIDNLLLKLSA